MTWTRRGQEGTRRDDDSQAFRAVAGVLLAQNSSVVYYTILANDVYAHFASQINSQNRVPSAMFPTTQTELNAIQQYAGKTFSDGVALAVEVKLSWVDISAVQHPQNYITSPAFVPTYDTSNPQKWVPTGKKFTTLALVGVHFVGSVSNHPEMVWSTFENFRKAESTLRRMRHPFPYGPASRSRVVLLPCLLFVVVLGLGSRSAVARRVLPGFVTDYAGDTLWATLVYLGLLWLCPRLSVGRAAAGTLGFSFVIEFSQLFHPPWLDALRAHSLAALVLGRGFLVSDLFCYAVGVALGAVLDMRFFMANRSLD